MRTVAKDNPQKVDWKRFEELVGRLERILGNDSIRVRINDQIRDNTGELRQIDASVRVSTGTIELLYIIECRNRNKVSDVTWVEQVAKKRERVGAHSAVLVSNKNLSSNAIAAAKKENIEVRTLETLDASLFASSKRPWMRMSRVRWSQGAKVEVRYDQTDELPIAEYQRIQSAMRASSSGVRFAFADHEEPKTPEQVVTEARELLRFESFPPGESQGIAVLEMVHHQRSIHVLFEDKRLRLRSLKLTFEGFEETIEPTRDYLGQYQQESGSIDHMVAESSYVHNGNEIAFTAVTKPGVEGIRVNIPYGFATPEVQASMDKEKGATIEVFFENDEPHFRRLH